MLPWQYATMAVHPHASISPLLPPLCRVAATAQHTEADMQKAAAALGAVLCWAVLPWLVAVQGLSDALVANKGHAGAHSQASYSSQRTCNVMQCPAMRY